MVNFFVSLIVGIFMGDNYLKQRMEKQLRPEETREICGGRLRLRIHRNRGAMLGVGKRRGLAVTTLSVLLTLFAALVFVLSLSVHGSNLLRVGLSLLLGGAFSNTYDRLKQQYVTDYISLGIKWEPLRRLVFNLSDFCIMAGAMLSVLGWKHQEKKLRKVLKSRLPITAGRKFPASRNIPQKSCGSSRDCR